MAPACPAPTLEHGGPAPSPHSLGAQLCSGAWWVHGFPIAVYLGVLVGVEAPWKAPFLTRLLRRQAAQHHGHRERGAGEAQ